MRERFSGLNLKYFEAAMYQIRVFSIFVPLIEVMSSIALALIIWYGGGGVAKKLHHYRNPGRLHFLYEALFPAHSRVFAKIHHCAICDGLGRKDISTA